MRDLPRGGWRPVLAEGDETPIYLAIADAMAADIAGGRLQAGQRLPAHRALAEALAVDLTTVTRAYGEARRRGLIEAIVGRGTFVRMVPVERRRRRDDLQPSDVDIDMNLPPQPQEARLGENLVEGFAALQGRPDFLHLLTYRQSSSGERDRAAGAVWLNRVLPMATSDRVLICRGAQSALLLLLTTYLKPGDAVLTDALTYSAFRMLAAYLGVRLVGVAGDEEGMLPDALEQACHAQKAKALYLVPTIHNPTTVTMPLARRQAVAAIARRHGMLLFTDDAYGQLPTAAPEPLAALAPDLTFHIATLAKCITPGLRVAYLLVPDAVQLARLTAGLRATAMMASPLMAALASHWIGNGTALAIADAIRRESTARQRLAREILPKGSFAAHPQGHHLWLTLPATWSRLEFSAHLRRQGLAVVPSDAFAIDSAAAPNAVRIALGAAPSRDQLKLALMAAADALSQPLAIWSQVV